MCEKPLGLNAGEVREMYHAVRDAGVVHMTAFTYRFAPSMRYLKHLVEQRSAGRAAALSQPAVSGLARDELGLAAIQGQGRGRRPVRHDDPPHRLRPGPAGADRSAVRGRGPLRPADRTADGGVSARRRTSTTGRASSGEFGSGATGVWEGTTLAKGYGRNGFGHEWAEINGSEASAVYRLHEPNTILLGRTGQDLAPVDGAGRVAQAGRQPAQPGRRQAGHGVPLRFGLGIRLGDRRAARRGAQFLRGLLAQIVADAVLQSYAEGRWLDVPDEPR